MRALNSKESSILTSNLSSDDQLIPQQEIITDMSQLRTLSNLCESLVSLNSGIHMRGTCVVFFLLYREVEKKVLRTCVEP